MDAEPRRKPGRPKGSRNKPKPPRGVLPDDSVMRDFKHADPMTLIARNFALIDWQQQALRSELQECAKQNLRVTEGQTKKLVELSNSLVRSVDALRKANDALEELKKNLTPAQLLDAAVKKIKGQDVPTLKYIVRQLEAYLEFVAAGKTPPGDLDISAPAADALASLEVEDE